MQETRVQALSCEDSLEKEMATHFSILAWKSPWTNVGQATSQHQEAKSREGESRQGASPTGVSLQAPKSPLGRTLPLAPVCRAQRQPATSRVAIHCEDNQRASAGLTVHSRPMRVQEPPSHAKRAPLALSPSGRSQVAGGTGKEAAEPYHSRMLEGRGSAQM